MDIYELCVTLFIWIMVTAVIDVIAFASIGYSLNDIRTKLDKALKRRKGGKNEDGTMEK